jgi:small subunit ribosomal protein S11
MSRIVTGCIGLLIACLGFSCQSRQGGGGVPGFRGPINAVGESASASPRNNAKKSSEKGDKSEKAPVEKGAEKGAEKASGAKKKIRRSVSRGIVFVKATFNNTLVTITDTNGDTLVRESAGTSGFKGSRKSTPFAAQMAAEKAARAAMEHGLRRVEVQVKGPGSGRDTAVRSIQGTGIEVTSIKDVTPVPHNGCRQPKRRRT